MYGVSTQTVHPESKQILPNSYVYFNLLRDTWRIIKFYSYIQQLCALPTLYLCVLYLS